MIDEIKVDNDINTLSQKIFRLPQIEAVNTYRYIDSVYGHSDYIRINVLDNFASTHQRIGNQMLSRDLNLIGLRLAQKHNSAFFLFQYNELLSYHYFDRSLTDSAIYYINEAEKIVFENPKRLSNNWPAIYNRKSQIEGQLGNYEKRDYYMDQTIASIDTIPDHPSRGYHLGNIVYHYKFTKNYKKHAFYANKLKEHYLKKNDYNMSSLHTSIASILSFEDNENYIKELRSILNSAKKEDNLINYDFISTSLAEAYISNKDYNKVVALLAKRTLDTSSEMNTVDRILNLMNLEDAYKGLGDYKNAYIALDYRKILQDSIKRKEVIDKVANYEVKYETERKESQLKLVSLENDKNKQQKHLFSIIATGGIIASVIIGFLFFTNKKKNRQLEKQKKLLEKTVDEKNVLLRETHHRVKNSFQIVSSLLYLQSESIEDKEAQLAVKEAENRVRSMVLIHQKLYSKDDLVGINTKEYIEDLTKDIMDSHQSDSKSITYDLKIEPKVLDIETITPLGLILNELITNVLKHAFKDSSEKKKMSIEFKQDHDELVLSVKDNGIGMPLEIRESSFGLKLIRALSKKLKAKLNFDSNTQGTIAQVRMKRFEVLS